MGWDWVGGGGGGEGVVGGGEVEDLTVVLWEVGDLDSGTTEPLHCMRQLRKGSGVRWCDAPWRTTTLCHPGQPWCNHCTSWLQQ